MTYAHTGLRENKCQNTGWYRHTLCLNNPKFLSQTGTRRTIILLHNNIRAKVSSGYTLIPRQPFNQTTIIIVIYNHIGLEENKYQNIRWYKDTPRRNNPTYLSQTRCTGTVMLVHHNLRVKYIKWLYPHTQPPSQPKHYCHSNIRSYRSGGGYIQKHWMVHV